MTYRCDRCRREYDVRPAPSCPACNGRLSIVDELPLEGVGTDCALAACVVPVDSMRGGDAAPERAPDLSGGGDSGGGGATGEW